MTPDVEVRPESGLWKDSLGKKEVIELATQLGRAYKKFDQSGFVAFVVTDEYFTLELKERIHRIAFGLKKFLPKKYSQAISILKKTAPHLGTFENWSLLTYIENYGLNHFKDSIDAMEKLTQFSTAEFAIRPFMIRYTQEMIPILHRWAKDSNEHVRRLAAEGSRPRGVWVAHIDLFKKDPTEVFNLLELLKSDESLYVRKAVANNLNDISKEHPKKVVQVGKRWLKDKNKYSDWIVKHGCRSLLKKGYPPVFALFGFTDNPKLKIDNFTLNKKKISIGESAILSFDLRSTNTKPQKLAIDYRMHYIKKSGNRSMKVFKFSEKKIQPKEKIRLSTKHGFADLSTRKHYTGLHKVELVINGEVLTSFDFSLT